MNTFIIICFATYALFLFFLLILFTNIRIIREKLKKRESLFQSCCQYGITGLLASAAAIFAETGPAGLICLTGLSAAILLAKKYFRQILAKIFPGVKALQK